MIPLVRYKENEFLRICIVEFQIRGGVAAVDNGNGDYHWGLLAIKVLGTQNLYVQYKSKSKKEHKIFCLKNLSNTGCDE